MPTMYGPAEIETRLAARGLAGGVRALVERWRQHVSAHQLVSLEWEYEPCSLFPPRHQAAHDNGIFVIDPDERDGWVLTHEWPGWGSRELGRGGVRELKAKALQLARTGGPFGGAENLFRRGTPTPRCPASGMLRHAAADGELRTREFVRGLLVALKVKCDGTFAYRLLDPAESVEVDGPSDRETLVLDGRRTPWIFTEVWPVLGTICAPALDLLACWLASDEVAIVAVGDRPLGALVGTWAQVRGLDVDRWLSSIAEQRTAPAVAAPPADPEPFVLGWPDDPSPPEPPGPRRATRSPTRSVAERVEPAEPMKPPAALADALAAYMAVVEGELPTRRTGAEFARELIWALTRAAIAGEMTTTGSPAELYAELHRRGHLKAMPSDQVGRDALKILVEHTPLVRRLHYRRWCLAFGDLLDPESPLRAALRRYERT